MASLWVFLLAAAWPLAKRILMSLGVGILTYASLGLIFTQVSNAVVANWGAMSTSVIQVLSLAGIPDSVGIILGALSARVALVSIKRLGIITA